MAVLLSSSPQTSDLFTPLVASPTTSAGLSPAHSPSDFLVLGPAEAAAVMNRCPRVETYPPKSAKKPLTSLPRPASIKYGSSDASSPSQGGQVPDASSPIDFTAPAGQLAENPGTGSYDESKHPTLGSSPRSAGRPTTRSPPPFRPVYDGPSYSDSRIQYLTSILTVEDLRRQLKSLVIAPEIYSSSAGADDGLDSEGETPYDSQDSSPVEASAPADFEVPPSQPSDFCDFVSVADSAELLPPAAQVTRNKSWPKIPHKFRRRVAFADDRGHQLCTVKVMTESSDVPPTLESTVVRNLLKEQFPEDAPKPSATWEVDFKQPAADYLAFRHRLTESCVVLENAFVRNELPCRLVGSVKVKNIAFEKQVFLRITENNWISFMDREAVFSSGGGGGCDAWDTFAFDVAIPTDTETLTRISFCVCFRAGDGSGNGAQQQEFWDNSAGRNYSIVSQRQRELWNAINANAQQQFARRREQSPISTAYDLEREEWSNFAPWKNLTAGSDGPYW